MERVEFIFREVQFIDLLFFPFFIWKNDKGNLLQMPLSTDKDCRALHLLKRTFQHDRQDDLINRCGLYSPGAV